MNHMSRLALIAAVSVLALLGAACGGSADEDLENAQESIDGAVADVEDAVDDVESELDGDVGAAVEDAIAEATTFEVALSGDAEVPGPGSDGSGTATVTVGLEEVCVEGQLDGVEPVTAGHIHEGAADASGGVVVDLGVTTGEDGAFSSCGQVDAELAAEIVATPSDFYLNLHNEAYPDGAVRGQLS